ncbi:MAG: hypothetical protein K8T89_26460, partial [Planctomycetes bacterium]|nr:hypothetical protein [Planctomycetota bacterium]
MKFGIRELLVMLLAIISIGAFLRFREMNTVAGGAALDPSEELVVWNSHRPVGQTWANLGPKGGIEYPENSGIDGKGKALTLRMAGDGYRACGLNWKGWYPADAHDDVSAFHSLVFHVRQIGTIENLELRVSLVDNFKRSNGETASNTQYVVGDGALKRIDGEWRKVILPLSKFAQNKPLKLDRIWGIDFANEGTGLAVVQIDRISFSKERPRLPTFSEKPSYQASATLLLDAKRHQINDGIYGVCDLPVDQLREYGIPLTRWGGNTSSRFNWKINADNGASDWFFKNRGQVNDGGYLKHIKTAQSIG